MGADSDSETPVVRPGWILLAGAVLVLLYGGWTFWAQASSDHWQAYEEDGAVPAHRVNLSSDPHPPEVGTVTWTVHYDFVDFMNSSVNEASVEFTSPTGTTRTVSLSAESDPRRDTVYRASVDMSEPGTWNVVTRMERRGNTSRTEFTVPVGGEANND